MTARRESYLAARRECPRCRALRVAHGLPVSRVARFQCGAVFALDGRGEFVVWQPCPTDSERTARHWNQQTKGD